MRIHKTGTVINEKRKSHVKSQYFVHGGGGGGGGFSHLGPNPLISKKCVQNIHIITLGTLHLVI